MSLNFNKCTADLFVLFGFCDQTCLKLKINNFVNYKFYNEVLCEILL